MRWLRSAAWTAARVRGEETPFGPYCSGNDNEEEDEDEEEGAITPASHSLPTEDLSSLGDLFS
jgi:hypothetical protein